MKKFLCLMFATMIILSVGLLTGCTNTDGMSNDVHKIENDTNINTEIGGDGEVVKNNITIQDIVTTLQKTYGDNYLPSMEMDQDAFNMHLGITSDMYIEFYGAMPAIGVQADKLFIVKTDDVDTMKSFFEDYFDSLKNDSMQYTINLPKIAHGQIYTSNEYVIFFILGGYCNEEIQNAENMNEAELEEAVAMLEMNYYKKQSEIGINALNELFK